MSARRQSDRSQSTTSAPEALETRRLFAAPVASVDLYALNEDESLVVAAPQGVLANDFDPDGPTPPLTAQVVDQPQHGILNLQPDGGFNYTPNADYNGSDGFSYLADDGIEQSAATGVALNIAPVQDPGKIAFSASNFVTDEQSGTGIVTVVRAGGTEGIVSVDYATTPGTATEGDDYTPTSGTLTFQDGESTKDIFIGVVSDDVPELSETIGVTLSNPQGGATFAGGIDPSATLTIANSDPPPSVFIADPSPIFEGNPGDAQPSVLPFAVTLSRGSTSPIVVSYTFASGSTTPGEDFDNSAAAANNGVAHLTFAPGQTSAEIDVPIIGDAVNEPDEDVSIVLSSATNAIIADSVGTGTILNDDNLPPIATDQTITRSPGDGPLQINFGSIINSPDGDPLALTIHTPPGAGTVEVNDGGTPNDASDDVATYTPDGVGFQDERFTYEVSDRFGGRATGSIVIQTHGVASVANPLDPTQTDLLIAGTSDADNIRVQRTKVKGQVDVTVDGVDAGVFAPTGRIIISGGDGDDVIDARGLPNGVDIFGGDGNDTLRGSKGADMLFGGVGDDILRGGDRRDILVGGGGADLLAGGDNDDILIGGNALFDADTPAARQFRADVLAAWTGPNSASARTDALTSGAGERSVKLSADTVFDDDASDVLAGGGGNDWYFGASDTMNPNHDRFGSDTGDEGFTEI